MGVMVHVCIFSTLVMLFFIAHTQASKAIVKKSFACSNFFLKMVSESKL